MPANCGNPAITDFLCERGMAMQCLDVDSFKKPLAQLKKLQKNYVELFLRFQDGTPYGVFLGRNRMLIGYISDKSGIVHQQFLSFYKVQCDSGAELVFKCPHCGNESRYLYLTKNFACRFCTTKLS